MLCTASKAPGAAHATLSTQPCRTSIALWLWGHPCALESALKASLAGHLMQSVPWLDSQFCVQLQVQPEHHMQCTLLANPTCCMQNRGLDWAQYGRLVWGTCCIHCMRNPTGQALHTGSDMALFGAQSWSSVGSSCSGSSVLYMAHRISPRLIWINGPDASHSPYGWHPWHMLCGLHNQSTLWLLTYTHSHSFKEHIRKIHVLSFIEFGLLNLRMKSGDNTA